MSLTIQPQDARLSILGYQPEAVRLYWSAVPAALPVHGRPLDLSGAEITAVYADGSEAVVTDYVTFSPDTGASVPDAKTLTVTATYTARSGKVLQADEILPIVVPELKIIVPHSVGILYEGGMRRNGPAFTYAEEAAFFGFEDLETWLFWKRDGVTVRAQKVDAPLSTSSGFYHGGNPATHEAGVSHDCGSATYERYYSPTEHEVLDYAHAATISAEIVVAGRRLTDTAKLEVAVVDRLGLVNLPTTYTEEEDRFTLTNDNIRIYYSNGETRNKGETSQQAHGFRSGYPLIGYEYVDTWPISPSSGSVNLGWETFPGRLLNSYSYTYDDGRINWS